MLGSDVADNIGEAKLNLLDQFLDECEKYDIL